MNELMKILNTKNPKIHKLQKLQNMNYAIHTYNKIEYIFLKVFDFDFQIYEYFLAF